MESVPELVSHAAGFVELVIPAAAHAIPANAKTAASKARILNFLLIHVPPSKISRGNSKKFPASLSWRKPTSHAPSPIRSNKIALIFPQSPPAPVP
jgi:hypothetical protein